MKMLIPDNIYDIITSSVPIVCVDLVVINDGKVLLLKRRNPPARGQWWLPGGRIFKNESIRDAAVRKGRQEIGLVLEPREMISVEETIFTEKEDKVDIHTINIVMKMKIVQPDFTIKLDQTHVEYKWFEKIPANIHEAVRNPLVKMNFEFEKGAVCKGI